jgi:uncharacterized protein YqcC (DUF446 family)
MRNSRDAFCDTPTDASERLRHVSIPVVDAIGDNTQALPAATCVEPATKQTVDVDPTRAAEHNTLARNDPTDCTL